MNKTMIENFIIMIKKIFWHSLVNIKRRASISTLFFIISFVISAQLFLIMLTSSFLTLPQYSGIKGFFYTTGLTSVILILITIPAVSLLYCKSRYQDYAVFKIFGIKKTDIVVLFSMEIFMLAISGALLGSITIMIFIAAKIIYLPDFLINIRHIWSHRLISIFIKSIFGVSLTIVAISYVVFLLRFNSKYLHLSEFGD